MQEHTSIDWSGGSDGSITQLARSQNRRTRFSLTRRSRDELIVPAGAPPSCLSRYGWTAASSLVPRFFVLARFHEDVGVESL